MRISSKEKLNIASNLATMIGAGIPILEAVDLLYGDAKGGSKVILGTLLDDLSQGRTVNESFAKYPKVFSNIDISLLAASEESGNLDVILKDLEASMRKNMDFNSKVKGALLYPALLVVMFLVIFTVILTFVIPRIGSVFTKMNVNIPLPTRILMAMSSFVLEQYILVIGVILLLLLISILLYVFKREWLTGLLFSLPLVTKLVHVIDLAQFTKSLHLLLSSGIPIVSAVESSSHVVVKRKTKNAILLAGSSVMSGKPFSDGLMLSPDIFPKLAVRIVEAGERSGTLEESLLKLSVQYEDQVTNTLKQLTTMLEPIMLIVIGVFVGGIMISIIAPIYQLMGNISPR